MAARKSASRRRYSKGAGKTVASAGEVRDAVTAARDDKKNSVLMRVKSGGSSRFVAVPLAKG